MAKSAAKKILSFVFPVIIGIISSFIMGALASDEPNLNPLVGTAFLMPIALRIFRMPLDFLVRLMGSKLQKMPKIARIGLGAIIPLGLSLQQFVSGQPRGDAMMTSLILGPLFAYLVLRIPAMRKDNGKNRNSLKASAAAMLIALLFQTSGWATQASLVDKGEETIDCSGETDGWREGEYCFEKPVADRLIFNIQSSYMNTKQLVVEGKLQFTGKLSATDGSESQSIDLTNSAMLIVYHEDPEYKSGDRLGFFGCDEGKAKCQIDDPRGNVKEWLGCYINRETSGLYLSNGRAIHSGKLRRVIDDDMFSGSFTIIEYSCKFVINFIDAKASKLRKNIRLAFMPYHDGLAGPIYGQY
ncbi:MAG: hypothetical protein GF350_03050, partial [Chitinivibrionales bacterium]|nr:hypothetical protein [Chitinivibrionales bacterium]